MLFYFFFLSTTPVQSMTTLSNSDKKTYFTRNDNVAIYLKNIYGNKQATKSLIGPKIENIKN